MTFRPDNFDRSKQTTLDLYVPGRLCLFGEHSDWAGQYRAINAAIQPGYALVVGTERGIFARVRPHHHLVMKSINCSQILNITMDEDLLLNRAKSSDFYSYVAGVAYQALRLYGVGGIEIDNYQMTLPLQKGLSSSAAICVLVARAFNQLYNLGLTIAEEMNLAYVGERTTPSQCGKLDQACAYGRQPILMTFDGDRLEIQPLSVGKDLYLIVVDLAGYKDTQAILAQLNQCYPHAQNSLQQGVHDYLGRVNAEIVTQAQAAIEIGDSAQIGALMNYAQQQFDLHLTPACPDQLQAPLLHQLLAHPPLQSYIYGGKGVGSQGDGTAQLIAHDLHSQQQAIALIRRDFPTMDCHPLTIPQQCRHSN